MRGHSIPVIVVVTLAALALGGLAIMGYLSFYEKPIPDQIDRLTVGAVGALGAILATTRSESVTVDNPPTDPVPTSNVKEK